jgi:hypothetical protein
MAAEDTCPVRFDANIRLTMQFSMIRMRNAGRRRQQA